MQPVSRRSAIGAIGASVVGAWLPAPASAQAATMQSWPLATPRRTGIHDVAPAPDGGVWFTAQRTGQLGWFDPKSARVELIPLGKGSSPHGVIQGPDKAAWITDSGLNAIVRVGWPDRALRSFPMPEGTPTSAGSTRATPSRSGATTTPPTWASGTSG